MDTLDTVTLVLTVLAAVIGFVGNTSVLISVVRFKHMQSSVFKSLAVLAVVDLILCVVSNPFSLAHTLKFFSFTTSTPRTDWQAWADQCDAVLGVGLFASLAHLLALLAIAVERCIYMASQRAHDVYTSKMLYAGVILGLVVLAAVLTLVAVVESPALPIPNPCWFSVKLRPVYSEVIVSLVIALALTSFVAFFTIYIVQRGIRKKATSSPQSDTTTEQNAGGGDPKASREYKNAEDQASFPIAICILIFVPSFLTGIIVLSEAADDPTMYSTWVYHLCFWFVNLFSCINPVIYLVHYPAYRNTLFRMVFCKWSEQVEPLPDAQANGGS